MKKRFAFIPMLVAFVFALALSACGGASAEDLIRADLESYFGDPENAAEEFASGLEESAPGCTCGSPPVPLWSRIPTAAPIGEITVDGDTATAEVTLTIKSFGDIMTTFQSDFTDWAYSLDPSTITSEDDLYKQGGQMLLDATRNAEAKENTYEVTYTRNSDGDWEMDAASESELTNAVIS